MPKDVLDSRKQHILKAVVDDYIATAEPVGSKSLVAKHGFNCSSATIRNEMAELEALGYLEQPHTSSGRVPSDKGYRAYVDQLLLVEELPDEQAQQIKQSLNDNLTELTGLIRKASSLLSDTTGYTSLALTPHVQQSHLQQIKMLMIEPGRALVVVVLSAGVVKDRLVRIPDILDANQLMQVASAIEEGLSGKKLDDITLVTVATAARNAPLPEPLLNQVLYEAYVAIKQADNLELYIDGQHNLLSYPEFHDIDKAQNFFKALARDGMIAGYMRELNDTAGLLKADTAAEAGKPRATYMIRIGQEISVEGLHDCSFVTTTYQMGSTLAGRIGVIGPKRMAYGKVISNIRFVKQTINEKLRQRQQKSKENLEDVQT